MLRRDFFRGSLILAVCSAWYVVTTESKATHPITANPFHAITRRAVQPRFIFGKPILIFNPLPPPPLWTNYVFNIFCIPSCNLLSVLISRCGTPPSRYELCKSKLFLNICCWEWRWGSGSGSGPGSGLPSFNGDCTISCVADFPCPFPYCKLCEKLQWNHRCCRNAYAHCAGAPPPSIPPPRPPPSPGGSEDPTTEDPFGSTTTEEPITPPCINVPDTICQSFNGRPAECRLAEGCGYNCEANTCQNKRELTGPCFSGCFRHCQDRCGCSQRQECSYDNTHGVCKSRRRFCMLTDFTKEECCRKNHYYSVGGALCLMKTEMGDCSLESTVIAVNLGGEEAIVDHNGIEYRPEAEFLREDKYGISENIDFPAAQIKAVKRSDAVMYSTAVVGSVYQCVNDSKLCIGYKIPTGSMIGNYELGIRLVEGVHNAKGQRRFSVSFAGIDVVSELDIFGFTGEQFHPMDIYVNFKVTDEGKTITVKGQPPQPLQNPAKLLFCKGDCGTDNAFLVSGFHVIKQKAEDIPDPCVDEPIEDCRKEDFTQDRCLRVNHFYSVGGVICKNTEASGTCTIVDTILAVNMNGEAVTDSRGVRHIADKYSVFQDPEVLRVEKNSSADVQGAAPEDVDLYKTIIYGDDYYGVSGECINYPVHICEDGSYELTVNLLDDESTGIRKRKFTIMFGTVPIFPEVDIFGLTGQISTAVSLNAHFRVSRNVTRLRFKGVKYSVSIPDNTLPVKFCYGGCREVGTVRFMMSAFSVVKYGSSVRSLGRSTTCALQTSACACRFTGYCEFNVNRNTCEDRDEVCTIPCNSQICHRGGAHVYYLNGGAVCNNNRRTSGNCAIEQTILAVNFNGDAHTDVHGIEFQPDTGIPFTDPDNTKLTEVSTILTSGVPSKDLVLYQNHIWGENNAKLKKACTSYDVPLSADGKYELSIKTGEVYHDGGKRRAFSYKFNNNILVRDFSPGTYAYPPNAMDLNLNFEVTGGGTTLKMNGYGDTPITGGVVPLGLCFGECGMDDVDINWVIGAFSVVKFKNE